MAVQSINNTQPLRINPVAVNSGTNNTPKMIYIPPTVYRQKCENGYCDNRFLNYLA